MDYRRVMLLGGLMDWVGEHPPTSEALRGRKVLEEGEIHVKCIRETGGQITGNRLLGLEAIKPRLYKKSGYIARGLLPAETQADIDISKLSCLTTWGYAYILVLANHRFANSSDDGSRPEPSVA